MLTVLAVLQAGTIVWEMFLNRLVRGPEGVVAVITALLLAVPALVVRQLLLRGAPSARSRAALAVLVVLLGAIALVADGVTALLEVTTLAVAGDLGLPIALVVVLVVAGPRRAAVQRYTELRWPRRMTTTSSRSSSTVQTIR